ncbi:uncharacterized protein RCC_00318 [Ramularia collo-cygni]|uniref:Major facilitator superfamily (MFS) profile domain-containing protein n=1 Tax=Ramularia collo-cygni TaxID=112498 RepID=A0A2D3ULV4_9PEZI|nr:uncharacterized protein RCC_00318 [Ramularia collo-cygni]CZT14341.1 uncharacterized protein RCC_00318 [Ramularia collo-cygni]
MYAVFVVLIVYLAAFVSTFGASIAVGGGDGITATFEVPESQKSFLVSTYLMGCGLGPLLFSPLSERCGRKWSIAAGVLFMATFTTACTKAPNWGALLAFRFLAGLGSSATLCTSNGIFADIAPSPAIRGIMNCWTMVLTALGPLMAAITSISVISRWPDRWDICFLINAGIAWLAFLAVLSLPETSAKVVSAASSIESQSMKKEETWSRIVLPLRMIFMEPIVTTSTLFLSLLYSIFFLFFQLLPRIGSDVYGFGTDRQVIVFVPIAIGAILAGLIITILEPALQALSEANRYKSDRQQELRRLPPACIGSFLVIISLFVVGYVVASRAHYMYMLVGEAVFSLGMVLIFMGLTNYVADSYKTAIASAIAPTWIVRNFLAAGLSFAAAPLYSHLGAQWELYLLGFLSLPFAGLICGTLYAGPWLREHSEICQSIIKVPVEQELKV